MDLSLFGFRGIHEMFNVHPLFVHFPIALIPGALLLYFLGTVFRKRPLFVAGRACLYLGLAGGILAIFTGLQTEETFPHNETIHHMMEVHENIGFVIGGLVFVSSVWSFWHKDQRPKGAWPFLFVLALASYLTLQNADIGGRMVYIEGAAVKPAVKVIASPEEQAEFEGEGGSKPATGEESESHEH